MMRSIMSNTDYSFFFLTSFRVFFRVFFFQSVCSIFTIISDFQVVIIIIEGSTQFLRNNLNFYWLHLEIFRHLYHQITKKVPSMRNIENPTTSIGLEALPQIKDSSSPSLTFLFRFVTVVGTSASAICILRDNKFTT